MILWQLLGGVVLFVLLGGKRSFERASVTSNNSLFGLDRRALGGLKAWR